MMSFELDLDGPGVAVCMRDYGPASHTPLTHGFGKCAKCEHPIFWAKSLEAVAASIPRWCVDCLLDRLEQMEHDKGDFGKIAQLDQIRAMLAERTRR